MKLPVSWIREFAPVSASAHDIARALINAGLEVEGIEVLGAGGQGDLVVGQVLEIEELTDFKKPIRWCQVDVGGSTRGIICGARNFAVGDHVVVALPGVVLPGDFTITARETYGHVSDGMICSERELGLGEDHSGILVLQDTAAGADAGALLGIGEQVLDIAVTPDRGYALSVRGIAREVATAFDVPFIDPAENFTPELGAPSAESPPRACSIDDFSGAELLTIRTVVGFNPQAPSPRWMIQRLQASGMRSISLAVDVTNYVMLELGQPTHAFDLGKVRGPIRVARAHSGDQLETLDHVVRELSELDVVIADDSGPIALAGTMGGFATEIDDSTTDIAIEAAYFPPMAVAGNSRRHKLSSEASRRFERGVDRELAPAASARVCALLLEYGGGTYVGMTAQEAPYQPSVIALACDLPSEVAGMPISTELVTHKLTAIGAAWELNTAGDLLTVTPPSWRPDLTQPADLVEEVVRLVGYEKLPSRLPGSGGRGGLTFKQRLRRRIGGLLAARGLSETLCYPFIGATDLTKLRIPASDSRWNSPKLANPLSEEADHLRSTLLPGLIAAAERNIGRGESDLALFEAGSVFLGSSTRIDIDPGVAGRPDADLWLAMNQALPSQPEHVAIVLTGNIENTGAWGKPRAVSWSDAAAFVQAIAQEMGVSIIMRTGRDPVFHPGRCAEIVVEATGEVIGYAGELHPQVVENFHLPSRSCAAEINFDALCDHAVAAVAAPVFSIQPVAKEDLALVVDSNVPTAEVERAIRAGAGELLEDVRLFDVYTGPQVGEGKKSLAFALRFRSSDHTLTAEEIASARDAAIASASSQCAAILR